eukprot:1670314-Prymnesium_polylepis.2
MRQISQDSSTPFPDGFISFVAPGEATHRTVQEHEAAVAHLLVACAEPHPKNPAAERGCASAPYREAPSRHEARHATHA